MDDPRFNAVFLQLQQDPERLKVYAWLGYLTFDQVAPAELPAIVPSPNDAIAPIAALPIQVDGALNLAMHVQPADLNGNDAAHDGQVPDQGHPILAPLAVRVDTLAPLASPVAPVESENDAAENGQLLDQGPPAPAPLALQDQPAEAQNDNDVAQDEHLPDEGPQTPVPLVVQVEPNNVATENGELLEQEPSATAPLALRLQPAVPENPELEQAEQIQDQGPPAPVSPAVQVEPDNVAAQDEHLPDEGPQTPVPLVVQVEPNNVATENGELLEQEPSATAPLALRLQPAVPENPELEQAEQILDQGPPAPVSPAVQVEPDNVAAQDGHLPDQSPPIFAPPALHDHSSAGQVSEELQQLREDNLAIRSALNQHETKFTLLAATQKSLLFTVNALFREFQANRPAAQHVDSARTVSRHSVERERSSTGASIRPIALQNAPEVVEDQLEMQDSEAADAPPGSDEPVAHQEPVAPNTSGSSYQSELLINDHPRVQEPLNLANDLEILDLDFGAPVDNGQDQLIIDEPYDDEIQEEQDLHDHVAAAQFPEPPSSNMLQNVASEPITPSHSSTSVVSGNDVPVMVAIALEAVDSTNAVITDPNLTETTIMRSAAPNDQEMTTPSSSSVAVITDPTLQEPQNSANDLEIEDPDFDALVDNVEDQLEQDLQADDAAAQVQEPPVKRQKILPSCGSLPSSSPTSSPPPTPQDPDFQAAVANYQDAMVQEVCSLYTHPRNVFFFHPDKGPIPQVVSEMMCPATFSRDKIPNPFVSHKRMLAEQKKQWTAGWIEVYKKRQRAPNGHRQAATQDPSTSTCSDPKWEAAKANFENDVVKKVYSMYAHGKPRYHLFDPKRGRLPQKVAEFLVGDHWVKAGIENPAAPLRHHNLRLLEEEQMKQLEKDWIEVDDEDSTDKNWRVNRPVKRSRDGQRRERRSKTNPADARKRETDAHFEEEPRDEEEE